LSCLIVGIDCATQIKKRGVAFAVYGDDGCVLDTVGIGLTNEVISSYVSRNAEARERVLFSLDAPLGWPVDIGKSLMGQNAGDGLSAAANMMFRRETDRYIKKVYGKQSLDVGADRIARTAHSALETLDSLRSLAGKDIPLVWGQEFNDVGAIEVYPAATLKVHVLPDIGYKDSKSEHKAQRLRIITEIEQKMAIGYNYDSMANNADALDAALCVLAGTF